MQAARTQQRYAAAALALGLMVGCGPSTQPPVDEAPPPKTVTAPPTAPPPPLANPPKENEGVADDGRRLWASPTAGGPISLAGVPDGAQLILHARPAALLSSEEGRRVWQALSSFVERADNLASADRFTLSVTPGEEYGALDTSLAVDAEEGEELPLLSREIESLADASDADHHATLIVSPEFLLGSGGALVGGTDSPLRRFVQHYCHDDWRALALGVHVADDRMYWELRVLGDSSTPELARARALVERLGETPDDAAGLVGGRAWSPHAERVVAKTPAMMTALSRLARRGAERRQTVVNGYLPAASAHNLVLAADLLVAELSVAPPRSTPEGTPAPRSLAERLRAPVTAVFEREPLEAALTVLANSMGATIEIEGRDLQLEGITRNQMLSLEMRDHPAETVLVELLRKANPDTLATGPTDPRQKLVYAVRGERLVITTRAAAERRGEALPDVFQP